MAISGFFSGLFGGGPSQYSSAYTSGTGVKPSYLSFSGTGSPPALQGTFLPGAIAERMTPPAGSTDYLSRETPYEKAPMEDPTGAASFFDDVFGRSSFSNKPGGLLEPISLETPVNSTGEPWVTRGTFLPGAITDRVALDYSVVARGPALPAEEQKKEYASASRAMAKVAPMLGITTFDTLAVSGRYAGNVLTQVRPTKQEQSALPAPSSPPTVLEPATPAPQGGLLTLNPDNGRFSPNGEISNYVREALDGISKQPVFASDGSLINSVNPEAKAIQPQLDFHTATVSSFAGKPGVNPMVLGLAQQNIDTARQRALLGDTEGARSVLSGNNMLYMTLSAGSADAANKDEALAIGVDRATAGYTGMSDLATAGHGVAKSLRSPDGSSEYSSDLDSLYKKATKVKIAMDKAQSPEAKAKLAIILQAHVDSYDEMRRDILRQPVRGGWMGLKKGTVATGASEIDWVGVASALALVSPFLMFGLEEKLAKDREDRQMAYNERLMREGWQHDIDMLNIRGQQQLALQGAVNEGSGGGSTASSANINLGGAFSG